MDIKEAIYNFDDELFQRDDIKFTETTTGFDRLNPNLDGFPDNLKAFYQVTNGLTMRWETTQPISDGSYISGNVKILPSERVLQDWKGVVYFENSPEPGMEKFKIVDFFLDEVCVGYFQDERKSDIMRYYTFEDEPRSLNVDFAGYFELLLMARGFLRWQKILWHLEGNSKEDALVEEFKKYMPQLFPAFKWEEFVALHERVRIK